MLYYPYRVRETAIKQHHTSWQSAYLAFKEIVNKNEQKFKFSTTTTWGDIDDAMHRVETQNEQIFDIDSLKSNETETITFNKSIDGKY